MKTAVPKRRKWLLVIATFPLWPIVATTAFAITARIKLGYWPQYDNPDPKTLNLPIIEIPTAVLVLLYPFPILAGLASVLVLTQKWLGGERDLTMLVVAIASVVVWTIWFFADPTGLRDWILD